MQNVSFLPKVQPRSQAFPSCGGKTLVVAQAAQTPNVLYILNIYTEYLTVIIFNNEIIQKILAVYVKNISNLLIGFHLSNDLSKFADDIAIIAPVYDYEDSAGDEVENMKLWSNENRMSLNMEKTYEMIVRGKVSTPLPDHIPSIKRKEWLKLLGVTMEDIPGKWDKHFEEMMKQASRRMYILRVCKHYGLSTHQLDLLFNKSLFSPLQPKFGVEHHITNT